MLDAQHWVSCELTAAATVALPVVHPAESDVEYWKQLREESQPVWKRSTLAQDNRHANKACICIIIPVHSLAGPAPPVLSAQMERVLSCREVYINMVHVHVPDDQFYPESCGCCDNSHSMSSHRH